LTATSPERPELTVVLCTYNPRPHLLAQVLDALNGQTLPKERWELLVVDNNSDTPLSAAGLDQGRGLPLRVHREPTQGLGMARRAGVLEARADLLVLVDDDNVLDPEYLERALDIARTEPGLGAFGGIARARIDGRLRGWQRRLLPFIGVRDYGPDPITSRENTWGPWEPIGAGMVLRRAVAQEFVKVVDGVAEASELDRVGRATLSAGDSLMARLSYRLGLACSYQPRLAFDHVIPRARLGVGYLVRIMYGHGRSLVKLNRVLGLPSPPLTVRGLVERLRVRLRSERLAGPLWWCWDLGYFVETRRRRQTDTGS
jgi:glycosyltransferase involved in cell wall biosynthesis